MANDILPVQMAPVNRDNLAEPLSTGELPLGPIKSTGVILPEYGGTQPSGVQYDRFTRGMPFGTDPMEWQAQQQSSGDRIANGLFRLVGTTATKFMEGVGFGAGMLPALASGDADVIFDNAFSAAWESLGEDIKEKAPIKHSRKYLEGNILQQMSTLGFYMDDVVDGAAFLASNLLGAKGVSAIMKATKMYSKLGRAMSIATKSAKLGKAGGLTGKAMKNFTNELDLFTMSLYNSGIEASFEARDTGEQILLALAPKIESGEMTWEEAKRLSSVGARNTFVSNIFALMPSNYITNSMFFRSFKGLKGNLAKARELRRAGKLDDFTKFTRRDAFAAFGKEAGKSVLSEGPWEENIQLAIQNLEEGIAVGDIEDRDRLIRLAGEWVSNYFTDEGQKAIALGAIIGIIPGGVGGIRSAKAEKAKIGDVKRLLDLPMTRYSDTAKTLFKRKTVAKGDGTLEYTNELEVDANGQPIPDYTKVAGEFLKSLESAQDTLGLLEAAESNNQVMFDYLKHRAFAKWAINFMKEEGGLAFAKDEVDIYAKQETEELQKAGENVNTQEEVRPMAAKYKQRLDQLQRLWTNIDAVTGDMNLGKDGMSLRLKEGLKVAQFEESAKQIFFEEKRREIEAEIADLETGPEAVLPQTKTIVQKLNRQLSQINDVIAGSEQKLASLFNEEKWRTDLQEQKEELFKAAETARANAAAAKEEADARKKREDERLGEQDLGVDDKYKIKDAKTGEDKVVEITELGEDGIIRATEIDENEDPIGEPFELSPEEAEKLRSTTPIEPDVSPEIIEPSLFPKSQKEAMDEEGRGLRNIFDALTTMHYVKGEKKPEIRNEEFDAYSSDPQNPMNEATVTFHIDFAVEKVVWDLLTEKQKALLHRTDLTPEQVNELFALKDEDSFENLLDVVPIGAVVKDGEKVFTEGIYYHRTDYANLYVPEGENINKYYKQKQKETRRGRYYILKRILTGQVAEVAVIDKTEGYPNNVEGTTNNVITTLGIDKNKPKLGVGEASGNAWAGTGVSDRYYGKFPAGSIVIGTTRTTTGRVYPAVLDPVKISETHAGIWFDALERKHSYEVTGYSKAEFPENYEDVKGLTVGEVLELLLNYGKKTSLLYYKNKGKDYLRDKQLYIEDEHILHYGTEKLDLRDTANRTANKAKFVQWANMNKNYAVNKRLTQQGVELNKRFNKDFKLGEWEVKKDENGNYPIYSTFLMENGAITTDLVLVNPRSVFNGPVIIMDVPITENVVKQEKPAPKPTVTKPTVKEVKPKVEGGVKSAKDLVNLPLGAQISVYVNRKGKEATQLIAEIVESEGKIRFKELDDGLKGEVERQLVGNLQAAKKIFNYGQKIVGEYGEIRIDYTATNQSEVTTEEATLPKEGALGAYGKIIPGSKEKRVFIKTIPKTEEENPEIISDPDHLMLAEARIERIIKTSKSLDEFSSRLPYSFAANDRQFLNKYVEARIAGETTQPFSEWRNYQDKPKEATPPAPTANTDQDFLNKLNDPDGTDGLWMENKYQPGEKYPAMDVKKELTWFFERFKGVPVELTDKLIKIVEGSNSTAFGQLRWDSILLFNQAEVGTIYHEAFHRVTQMYLTETERTQLYAAAKKEYSAELKNKSDRQVEELLAEKFRSYVMLEGEVKGLGAKIRRFFQRLYDMIYNFFIGPKRVNTSDTNVLFKSIQRGRWGYTKASKENIDRMKKMRYPYISKVVKNKVFHTIDTTEQLRKVVKGVTNTFIKLALTPTAGQKIVDFNTIKGLRVSEVFGKLRTELEKQRDFCYTKGDAQGQRWGDLRAELVDNFDVVQKLIEDKLLEYNVRKKTTYTFEGHQEEEFDLDNAFERYTTESFEHDPKDNVLAVIKAFVSSIPASPKADEFTGFYEYVDFSTMWNRLMADLHSVSDYKTLVQKIKDKSHGYFPYQVLAKKLDRASEKLRTQFLTSIRSHRHNYLTTLFTRSRRGAMTWEFGDADIEKAPKIVVREWNDAFVSSDSVYKDDKGRVQIDADHINEIYSEYEELRKAIIKNYDNTNTLNDYEDYKKRTIDILNRLSILIDDATLDAYIDSFEEDPHEVLRFIVADRMIKMFDKHTGTFRGRARDVKGKPIAIEKMLSEESLIRELSEYYVMMHPEEINNSVPGAEGAVYYAYGQESYVTHSINLLKDHPSFLTDMSKTVYAGRSRFLRFLREDPAIRKAFGVNTFSSFVQRRVGDRGRKYQNITDVEDYLTKLIQISKGKIPFPSMADRTTFYIYEGMPTLNFEYRLEGEKLVIPENVVNQFLDYAMDERDRIEQTQREIDFAIRDGFEADLINEYHYHIDEDGIRHYKATKNTPKPNGLMYQHFPQWNRDDFVFDRDAKPEIIEALELRIESELAKALEFGIIKYDKGGFANKLIDTKIINDLKTKYGTVDKAIHNVIAEYTVNTMMSVIETEKLFSHDPAFYKADREGNVTDDKIKRLTVLTSTGDLMRLDHPELTGNEFTSAVFRTQEYKTKVYTQLVEKHVELEYERLKKLPENKDIAARDLKKRARDAAKANLEGYLAVDSTDAQVYITPTMYRQIAIRLGEWTDDVQTAFDLLQSDKLLSVEDESKALNVVMKPLKLVYFGPSFIMEKAVPTYDKMSLATLFRRMVKGKEIEALLDRMENEAEPIDMVKFDSAVKVGLGETRDFYNEDGSVADLSDMHISDQSFQFLFRQQITDPHDVERTKTGTQFLKVAFSNLNLTDKVYDFAGEKRDGKSIANEAYAAIGSLSKRGRRKIMARLGISEGALSKLDEGKLLEMLRGAAIKAGMPDAIVDSLVLDPSSQGGFKKFLELDAFPDRRWIYSRIISQIAGETVDITFPGNQFIQMSNFGMKTKEQDDLRFKVDNDGNIQEMECRVSINLFKHMIPGYKRMTWAQKQNFVKNELSIIGYRIPTQGQNSLATLRIKELLPEQSGDTIMLPNEFTKLTGSDFDIDKLYVVRHNYQHKAGTLERVPFLEGDETFDLRYENSIVSAFWDNLGSLDQSDVIKLSKLKFDIWANLRERSEYVAEEGERIRALEAQRKEAEYNEYWDDVISLTLEIADFHERYGKLTDLSDRAKEGYGEALEAFKGIMLKKGLIPTKAEFAKWSVMEQNSKEAVENRLIDSIFSVLNSKEHFVASSTPLGVMTGKLRGLASRVKSAEGTQRTFNNLESASPTFQMLTKQKYLMGKDGIGPFALANVHHVFAQIAGLKLKGKTEAPVLKDAEGNIDLSQQRGVDGILISDWLSTLIDAHVDIAKDPYVIDLNVNAATYNVATLLLRAGAGEIAFKFMSQPILKEYARQFLRNRGRLGRGDFEIFESLKADLIENGAVRDASTKIWDKDGELLMKEIKGETPTFQLAVLEQFESLTKQGRYLFEATQASQIDTKKYGKNFSEIRSFLGQLSKVIKDNHFINFDKIVPFDPNNREVIEVEGASFLGEMLNNAVLFPLDAMSEQVMEATHAFADMQQMLLDRLGLTYTRDARIINEISNQIYSWLTARFWTDPARGVSMTSGRLQDLVKGDKSVVKQVHDIKRGERLGEKYPELKDNALIRHLNYTFLDNEQFQSFLTIRSTRNEDKFTKDSITSGWNELFEHNDPAVQEFAKELMVFSYYTSGFRQGMYSFYHFLPPAQLREIRHNGDVISFNDFIIYTANKLQSNDANLWDNAVKEIIENTWWSDIFVAKPRNDAEITVTPSERDGNVIRLAKVTDRSLYIGRNKYKQHIYKPYILLRTDSSKHGYWQLMKYVGYDKEDNNPIYAAIDKSSYNEVGVLVKENGLPGTIFTENKVEEKPVNPYESAVKMFPKMQVIQEQDLIPVELFEKYDDAMAKEAQEQPIETEVKEAKVEGEIRVPQLRTGEIVEGENVDTASISRTKEILVELNREDLTEEERQALTDEMEGLYYGEPEERVPFKKPPEDDGIYAKEKEYERLFHVTYTSREDIEKALKQIPGFSRKYHEGRIWVLRDTFGSNNYGLAVVAANRINDNNPGLIKILLDPKATREAGRQVWYPAINQAILNKQLKDINNKISEANEDIMPPLTELSEEQQKVELAKNEAFVEAVSKEQGNVTSILEHLKTDVQDKSLLRVINMLQNRPETAKDFRAFVVDSSEMNENAFMQVIDNRISINRDDMTKASYNNVIRSFAHEVLHMYTVEAVRNPVTLEEQLFAKEMIKLYKTAKANTTNGKLYGYKDVEEFTVELLTNKELIDDLKNQKYNLLQRIWNSIVKFFTGRDYLGETISKPVYDFVEKHAIFKPVEGYLMSRREGKTWNRPKDAAEDQDLKTYAEKKVVFTELAELNRKAIKSLSAKRTTLARSGKPASEILNQERIITRLFAKQEKLRGTIEFIKESARLVDIEFRNYRRQEQRAKEGTFKFSIQQLDRMKDSVEAFDVLEEYLAFFRQEKGLIPQSKSWERLYGVLENTINQKNIIKAAYEWRGLDELVDFLEPHFNGIYRGKARAAEKAYKAMSKAEQSKITLKEFVDKETAGQYKDNKEATRALLRRELKQAKRDVGVLIRWVDNMLDTRDPIIAAMVEKFWLTDRQAYEESIKTADVITDALRKLEKAFPQGALTDLRDYYGWMLEEIDGKSTQNIVTPTLSTYTQAWFKVLDDTKELPEEEREAQRHDWKEKNAPMNSPAFKTAKLDFLDTLVDSGLMSEKEYDGYIITEKRYWRTGKIREHLTDLVNEGNLDPAAADAIAKWIRDNSQDFREPIEDWHNPQWKELVKLAGGDITLSIPEQIQQVKANITKDPKIEFYNIIIQLNKEANRNIPPQFRLGPRLPGIEKEMTERIKEGQSRADIFRAAAAREFNVRPDEDERGNKTLTDYKGNPKYFLPVHYTAEVKPEDQSYDIPTLYHRFWAMGNEHALKQEILPHMEMVKFFIDERDAVERDSSGNAKKRKWSIGKTGKSIVDFVRTPQGKTLIADQFNDWMLMAVYGKKVKDEGSQMLRKGELSDTEFTEYETLLAKIGRKEKLTPTEVKRYEKLKRRSNDVSLDWAKFADFINKYTALNLLGLNFTQGTANIILGETLQLAEAIAGEYINLKSYHKANKVYNGHLPGMLADIGSRRPKNKISLLIEHFDILHEYEGIDFRKSTRFRQLMTSNTLFFMQHAGEHYMQGRFLLAFLENQRAKDKDGNDIGSMLDNYKVVNGKLTLNEKVDLDKSKWNDEQRRLFGYHVSGILSRLHGEYSDLGRVALQRMAIGRMAYMFRKFMVPGFKRRWGKAAYIQRLDDVVEGNYRSFNRFFGNFMKDLFTLRFHLIGENWSKLTKHEKANIHRTLVEANFLIAAIIMGNIALALRGEADDDKEKQLWSFAAYQMLRLRAELLFFTPKLDETFSILRSPMASMSVLENIIKLSGQIFDPLTSGTFEFDRYEQGAWKGKPKINRTLIQMTPGMKQLYRMRDIPNQVNWFQH